MGFQTDLELIRKRDREHVIRVLNDVVATEIVCVLRYKRHQFTATGLHAPAVAEEFAQHAADEQQHMDMAAERIVQLGGEPNLDPSGLPERSHTGYVPGTTLADMVNEDLVAERIVIQSYAEIIRWLGNDDATTRRLLEEILEQEEEHADDLRSLPEELDPDIPGNL